jgi:hypothetical protein
MGSKLILKYELINYLKQILVQIEKTIYGTKKILGSLK